MTSYTALLKPFGYRLLKPTAATHVGLSSISRILTLCVGVFYCTLLPNYHVKTSVMLKNPVDLLLVKLGN